MSITFQLVNGSIKGLLRVLCRVDDAQLESVPERGPLILVANHVNFLEVPLVFTHLQPRPIAGFAKAETWDNPLMALLFDLWGAIPIKRGEADLEALRKGLAFLEAGYILGVSPEGTRSNDGRLLPGHPGVVFLAQKTGAPLLPVVYYGGECFRTNITHLRRTDFHIIVGHPFHLTTEGIRLTREVRQKMVDEVMYQLAALLPSEYRGAYADLDRATDQYLCFSLPARNNLLSARQT
jgi:1-acyl-sn-glycerol-3-phosphate acyltransferase